jgi:hypothetical protein
LWNIYKKSAIISAELREIQKMYSSYEAIDSEEYLEYEIGNGKI